MLTTPRTFPSTETTSYAANRVPYAFGALVLVGGILLALWLARWDSQRNSTIMKQETAAQTQRLLDELPQLIQGYEKGVRGTRGAVLVGGQEHVSLATFLIYARSRDISTEFPGANGFGFIRRVAAEDEAAFLDEARRNIRSNFTIRQFAPHTGERDVVSVVEPSSHNLSTWGLDIASDARSRGAAMAALLSGRATLTAPIATQQPAQYDLLLLLPAYKPDMPTATNNEREAAGFGWAYGALNARQIFHRLAIDYQDFSLKISDVTESTVSAPFFSSGTFDTTVTPELMVHRALWIYGRRWNVAVQPTTRFLASLHLISPTSTFLFGMAVSLLLAALGTAVLMLNQHRRAERRNQELLTGIVANSTDVIIVESLDNLVISWNAEAERTFGYKAEEAIGRRLTDLILPPEMIDQDTDLLARSARGMRIPPFDTVRARRDGTLIDVSIATVSIIGADGRVSAVAKTLRDISRRKTAERALKQTNSQLEEMLNESSGQLESMQRSVSTIMDALPSLIGYWDTGLILRFANRAYASQFKMNDEELIGMPMRSVVGDEVFERHCPHALAALTGRSVTFETTLPGLNGLPARNYQVHYIPDIVDGTVQGLHALAHDITEITVTERRLRASEAFLDRAGIVAGVGGWELDLRTQRLTWSEQTYRIHEIETGNPLDLEQSLQFYPPESRSVIEGALAVGIATGTPWDVVVPFVTAKGRRLWVRSVGTVEFSGGTAIKLVGALQDVSERKLIEAQLRETNERFKIAADAAGIGIWEFDAVTGTLTWDDWIYRIYGVERGAGVEPAQLWKERLHVDDRARSQAHVAAALAGHGEFDTECRIVRPDGEIRYLQVASRTLRASDGSPLRITGVNIDITERRCAEQKIHQVSALLRNVLDSALEISIIATDPTMTITVFNRGAERLLGYSADQMIGQATPSVYHDADEIRTCAAQMTVQLGVPIDGTKVFTHASRLHTPHEWTYIRKDGKRVAVSLVVTPMIANDGEILGYLGIAYDVTRQKEYEASLRTATRVAEQANGAKSEFLANMSHEIRTPLNAIIGLGYLLDQTALSEDQRQFLSKIQFAGRALLGVINNVLDLSKIEAGEMSLEDELFDLRELLQDLSAMLTPQATTKSIQLLVQPTLALPRKVRGDASRLRQILTNLLSNAIKFTETGHVELRVVCIEQNADRVRLRCEVEDTGIGIEPAALRRLFTPFTQADASTTRRFGGTGLGLSIAKRFVELMGGEIGVNSRVGMGTIFWAELPLRLAVNTDLGAAGSLRVLIADSSGDEPGGLGAMVRALGLSPQIVTVGGDVLAIFNDAHMQLQPDVIIMRKRLHDIEARNLIARMQTECSRSSLPAFIVISDHAHMSTELQRENQEFARLADSILARPLTSSSLFNAINAVAATLPDTSARAIPHTRSKDLNAQRLHGVHILVVDDSEINREVAQRILERHCATVITCGDGQAAVDYVRKYGDTLDIVLMDVQMPLLDGNEATRVIRGELQRPLLPIIALTAGALVAERQRSIEAGMNDFVSKPFDPDALIDKVRDLVERARGKPIEAVILGERSTGDTDHVSPPSSIESETVRRMFGDDVTLFYSLLARMLEEYADLALPTAAPHADSETRSHFTARLHKLKGSAGMIGAHRVMRLAGAVETALIDKRPDEVVDDMLLQLASALIQLRDETTPMLAANQRRTVDRVPATSDGGSIEELHTLLEAQNLGAIDKFEEMSSWLRTTMTAASYERLLDAINNLEFVAGAQILRPSKAG